MKDEIVEKALEEIDRKYHPIGCRVKKGPYCSAIDALQMQINDMFCEGFQREAEHFSSIVKAIKEHSWDIPKENAKKFLRMTCKQRSGFIGIIDSCGIVGPSHSSSYCR